MFLNTKLPEINCFVSAFVTVCPFLYLNTCYSLINFVFLISILLLFVTDFSVHEFSFVRYYKKIYIFVSIFFFVSVLFSLQLFVSVSVLNKQ